VVNTARVISLAVVYLRAPMATFHCPAVLEAHAVVQLLYLVTTKF
jgi:hypothetical protein